MRPALVGLMLGFSLAADGAGANSWLGLALGCLGLVCLAGLICLRNKDVWIERS